MGLSLEARFEQYCDTIVNTLMHADREQPARWYIKGLMLPGERKSVEPMAARVQPEQVRSAHQSMHHLVAEAAWSDEAMLSAVAGAVLPKLVHGDAPVHWIVDDTGLPKKGKHSVGVARQYCGQTGKQDNCRVAVSLSIATALGSLPVGYRLYLPRAWTRGCGAPAQGRCARATSASRLSRRWRCARSRRPWRWVIRAVSCSRMPPTATRRRGASNWLSTNWPMRWAYGRGRRYGGVNINR